MWAKQSQVLKSLWREWEACFRNFLLMYKFMSKCPVNKVRGYYSWDNITSLSCRSRRNQNGLASSFFIVKKIFLYLKLVIMLFYKLWKWSCLVTGLLEIKILIEITKKRKNIIFFQQDWWKRWKMSLTRRKHELPFINLHILPA